METGGKSEDHEWLPIPLEPEKSYALLVFQPVTSILHAANEEMTSSHHLKPGTH
jgi:hypothetical protein